MKGAFALALFSPGLHAHPPHTPHTLFSFFLSSSSPHQ